MPATETLVELQSLTKDFVLPRRKLIGPPERVTAVDDVSFSIPAGSTFGVVGESGSGKTTVARLLLKLERPSAGTIRVDGEDIFEQTKVQERAYRRTVQAVLQDPYGALSQRMRIDHIVAEPLLAQGEMSRNDTLAVARRMIDTVGLPPDAATRYPHQFSGGQRQRIAIARALSVEPRLIVLDEPVSALDVSVRAQVLTLLRDLQARFGTTYLFVGHDLAIVRYMSNNIGVMYFGRLIELGDSASVLRRPLHPYTKRLVEAAAADKPLGNTRLTGEMPDPLAPPSGCHFRTRCSFTQKRCSDEVPKLRTIDSRQKVACHFVEAIASQP